MCTIWWDKHYVWLYSPGKNNLLQLNLSIPFHFWLDFLDIYLIFKYHMSYLTRILVSWEVILPYLHERNFQNLILSFLTTFFFNENYLAFINTNPYKVHIRHIALDKRNRKNADSFFKIYTIVNFFKTFSHLLMCEC